DSTISKPDTWPCRRAVCRRSARKRVPLKRWLREVITKGLQMSTAEVLDKQPARKRRSRSTDRKSARGRRGGFLMLRRGILEHLEDGRLTSGQFLALIVIMLKANIRTGVWFGSGRAIACILARSERTAKD